MYHTGADILGVLIARVSGQSFPAFLRERIFEPLGMHDTGFHVPEADVDRLATALRRNPATGSLQVFDPAAGGQWTQAADVPVGRRRPRVDHRRLPRVQRDAREQRLLEGRAPAVPRRRSR